MRMSGNLLNGIPPRERRVTSDDAANPRTTLKNGLGAPVPVRSRFPAAPDHTGDGPGRTRSFSRDEPRAHRVGRSSPASTKCGAASSGLADGEEVTAG